MVILSPLFFLFFLPFLSPGFFYNLKKNERSFTRLQIMKSIQDHKRLHETYISQHPVLVDPSHLRNLVPMRRNYQQDD